jgi:hypothetical protein
MITTRVEWSAWLAPRSGTPRAVRPARGRSSSAGVPRSAQGRTTGPREHAVCGRVAYAMVRTIHTSRQGARTAAAGRGGGGAAWPARASITAPAELRASGMHAPQGSPLLRSSRARPLVRLAGRCRAWRHGADGHTDGSRRGREDVGRQRSGRSVFSFTHACACSCACARACERQRAAGEAGEQQRRPNGRLAPRRHELNDGSSHCPDSSQTARSLSSADAAPSRPRAGSRLLRRRPCLNAQPSRRAARL